MPQKIRTTIRIGEADTLARAILREMEEFSFGNNADANAQMGIALAAQGKSMVNALTAARAEERKASELDAKDTARDTAFDRLERAIDGRLAEAPDSADALLLSGIMAKYHTLPFRPYDEESALIHALIDRLADTDVAAAVTSLNVKKLTDGLLAAQNDFETAYHAYHDAVAEKTETPGEIKKRLVTFMNTIYLPWLHIQARLDDESVYVNIARRTELYIDHANALIAARSRRAKGDEEPDITEGDIKGTEPEPVKPGEKPTDEPVGGSTGGNSGTGSNSGSDSDDDSMPVA